MLEAIREKAQGWIAWAIVILITIPFALWGIQQYLGGGAEPEVATVDGKPITQRELEVKVRNLRMNMREQLGDAYRPGMFDPKLLQAKTLDSMIRSTLLYQHAKDLGLGVSNAEVVALIQNLPLFQVGGKFSREAYKQGVRLQGMTSKMFEDQVRKSLLSTQLVDAIADSALVTPGLLKDYVRLAEQQRDFSYLRIKAADYLDRAKVDDAAIQAWYDSHPEQFIEPERVKIEYIDFALSSLQDRITVDDQALQDYYEQNIEKYNRPEKRQVRHILIAVDEGAGKDEKAAARQQAEALYEQLKQGADFAELARQKSQDAGSAANGGDLGILEPGTLGNAFDEVAFKLGEGEFSQPVETEFGYHIIQVPKIVPGGSASFASVKSKVEAEYRKQQAEKQFYDQAERLAELTYQNPDSLEPAAEEMELKIQHSDWLTRDGGSGVLSSPKVAGAAFSDDVLSEGNNSEAIELGPEHVLVLRVVEHEEQGVKPLAEVREAIRRQLASRQAAEQARKDAEAVLLAHRQGQPLEALAKARDAVLEAPGALKRNDPRAPAELLEKVFELPRPADGKNATALVELANGDAVVVELHTVRDGDVAKLSEAERKQLLAALRREYGDTAFEHYVQWLRDNAEIVIKLSENEEG